MVRSQKPPPASLKAERGMPRKILRAEDSLSSKKAVQAKQKSLKDITQQQKKVTAKCKNSKGKTTVANTVKINNTPGGNE